MRGWESSWNLNDLDSVLNDGLKPLKLSGINVPYLYFGGFRNMFSWHCEDLNMCSINYHHFGKPKFWYAIDKTDHKKFKKLLNKLFPKSRKKCDEYIRHKLTVVNPYVIKKLDPSIGIKKFKQEPGQFILTMCGGFHMGFNAGFNINEAVNFCVPE